MELLQGTGFRMVLAISMALAVFGGTLMTKLMELFPIVVMPGAFFVVAAGRMLQRRAQAAAGH